VWLASDLQDRGQRSLYKVARETIDLVQMNVAPSNSIHHTEDVGAATNKSTGVDRVEESYHAVNLTSVVEDGDVTPNAWVGVAGMLFRQCQYFSVDAQWFYVADAFGVHGRHPFQMGAKLPFNVEAYPNSLMAREASIGVS